jgi:hypothetical protein
MHIFGIQNMWTIATLIALIHVMCTNWRWCFLHFVSGHTGRRLYNISRSGCIVKKTCWKMSIKVILLFGWFRYLFSVLSFWTTSIIIYTLFYLLEFFKIVLKFRCNLIGSVSQWVIIDENNNAQGCMSGWAAILCSILKLCTAIYILKRVDIESLCFR